MKTTTYNVGDPGTGFQQLQITQYLLYELFKIEHKASDMIKCKTNYKEIKRKISKRLWNNLHQIHS